MDFIYAQAVSFQCDDIHDLLTRAFTPYVQKLGSAKISGPYPWLASAIDNGDVHVCLKGNEVLGVVKTRTQKNVWIIDMLGVDRAYQGAGIGSWLLKQLEQTARRKQITKLSLHTAEIMPDLVRFYLRHGFLETKRVLPEHGDDQHLRVHMHKLL